MKNYYITTAIVYSSTLPHIGNVYEMILADAIARYKRYLGYNVRFQTGTDEHGQKIEAKAIDKGISAKEYVDMISKDIKAIFDSVDISYNHFIRTTDPYHEKVVQKIFKKLYDNNDIYLGKYEGLYLVSEEAFVSETDLIDGKSKNGEIPIKMCEDAYFLKLSKYQDLLIKYINDNPDFIAPESRKNEMLFFLKDKLPDLCVSRTSFKWGIPVSFDSNHVVYVWIDALANYITGLEYDINKESSLFGKFWPADLHLIGKDILRFHTIYWPIVLMALGLKLPKQIFGHPWILFNKAKLSKSTGNIVSTEELVKYFGIDTVRYFVLHEVSYSQDSNLTYELVIERNNSDLANTLGNLVNRTIGMVKKYRNEEVSFALDKEPFSIDLKELSFDTVKEVDKNMGTLHVGEALESIMMLARSANKYIDVSEPWNLFKHEENEKLDHVLATLVETIRFIASLLQSFLPRTANKIAKLINAEDISKESINEFKTLKRKLNPAEVLFERYDLKTKIEEILGDRNE